MPNLKLAIKAIDTVFGEDYAKANPSLVGQYLQAVALHEIDKTLVEVVENLLVKFRIF